MITIFSTTQGEGHGAETVLCELLGAWPEGGFPLRIAAPRGSRVLECAGRSGHATVPLSAGRDALPGNAIAMRKAFRSGDTLSLAHAWSARGFEFAWWLKHRFGVPASGTLHDHPSARFHGNIRRRIMRLSSNRLDGLVAVSRAVADALAGFRVPVTVIHNGVRDVSREPEPHPSVRVGFLGMNAMAKGIPLVADWIDQCLPGTDIQWHLFGGPPSCPPALMARLQSCPPGRVVLRGRVAAEAIFNAIDILVHASTQFDSLPTVLIEAARAGIPCVASAFGGAPEIVNDGETGFLFNPSDPQSGLAALACLITDPQRRMAVGLAARRRYEQHFQAGAMASDYRDFWARLLAGTDRKDSP